MKLKTLFFEDAMTPSEKAKKKALSTYNKIVMMQPKSSKFPEPKKVTISADKRSEKEAEGYKFVEKKKPEIKNVSTKKTKPTKATSSTKEIIQSTKTEGKTRKLTKEYLRLLITEVINEQIEKIEYRNYYCPLCGEKSKHTTNHTGEIYTRCKHCGNSVLYHESFPEKAKKLSFKNAVFHYYDFNLEEIKDKEQYKKLVNMLQNQYHYKLFNAAVPYQQTKEWKKHNYEIIKLYKPKQFDNQFISNIGRIHYWYEVIFPNKKAKCGYWLEIK